MIIDFQDNTIEYIPVLMQNSSWIVVNSHIKRELSNSSYIDRVMECKNGLTMLKKKYNINSFREITVEMLDALNRESALFYKRLSHYVYENQRVLKVKKYLQNGKTKQIGDVLTDSHYSLRDLYEVSCDEIDYIIKISKDFKGWHGGRIMGGGFGGSTIHLVANDRMQEYQGYVLDSYTNQFGIAPDFIPVVLSNGIENI